MNFLTNVKIYKHKGQRTQLKRLRQHSLGILAQKRLMGPTQMLQKSLDHYNRVKHPQSTFNQIQDPQLIKLVEIQKNSMYKCFLDKLLLLDTKSEFRLVNVRGKIMEEIIQNNRLQIQKKKQIKTHYQQSLKQKYQICHFLYEDANKIKPNLVIKKNKIVRQISEEKNIILKKLDTFKKQIKQLQSLYTDNQEQILVLKQNQLYFVINLLRNGYYRFDGIIWHLNFFVKNNYVLKMEYLPLIFDQETKKCVMKEYKAMNLQLNSINEFPKIQKQSVLKNIEKIKQGSSMKKIYQSAGQILVNWVNNKEWKSVKKMKIKRQKTESRYNWQEKQKKRVFKVYSQENSKMVEKILFGIGQITRAKTDFV